MYTFHNTLKISDLRKHTMEVVEELQEENKAVTVFSRSQPKIVIMSFNLYNKTQQKLETAEAPKREKTGIDFFIDPPEELLIKKRGIDAVKEIRSLR